MFWGAAAYCIIISIIIKRVSPLTDELESWQASTEGADGPMGDVEGRVHNALFVFSGHLLQKRRGRGLVTFGWKIRGIISIFLSNKFKNDIGLILKDAKMLI